MFVLDSGEHRLFPGGSRIFFVRSELCLVSPSLWTGVTQDCLQRAQGFWFYARLPTFVITSAIQTLMMGVKGSAKGLEESQTRGAFSSQGQARPRE